MTALLLLGVGSGLCWGTADFFGGLQSRRLPTLTVALWSQLAGGLTLLLVLLAGGTRPLGAEIGWGIAAGLFSGSALVLFYRALAVGVMSIVAPVSACGALVPVAVSLALGQAPRPLACLGIVAALGGIILVSLQNDVQPHRLARPRAALALALGAALGFGLFYVFVDRGSVLPGSSPLWVVGGARIGSLAILLALVAASPLAAPWPGRRLAPVAAVGLLDTTANALYAYATVQGNLGVVSVLGSLYPVATVLLGRLVLAERLTRTQNAGVVLALAGVALLSVG